MSADPYDLDATGEAIDARRRVVEAALAELGEDGGRPHRYYAEAAPQYMRTKPGEKSWCGVFALWCLRRAGVCDWQWIDGRGFVSRLRVVAFPAPGDVAVFRKGADGRDLWHHAVVKDARNGRVYTIDGNVIRAPHEGVAERDRPIDSNVTFYSIDCLIGVDHRGPRE